MCVECAASKEQSRHWQYCYVLYYCTPVLQYLFLLLEGVVLYTILYSSSSCSRQRATTTTTASLSAVRTVGTTVLHLAHSARPPSSISLPLTPSPPTLLLPRGPPSRSIAQHHQQEGGRRRRQGAA